MLLPPRQSPPAPLGVIADSLRGDGRVGRQEAVTLLPTKDEGELFNIASNFAIRHHNRQHKTDYDAGIWLAWMFLLISTPSR
jgi:hypothetical protein